MKLLVIDGNSIVNRAFFGIKLLTTKDGRFTEYLTAFERDGRTRRRSRCV